MLTRGKKKVGYEFQVQLTFKGTYKSAEVEGTVDIPDLEDSNDEYQVPPASSSIMPHCGSALALTRRVHVGVVPLCTAECVVLEWRCALVCAKQQMSGSASQNHRRVRERAQKSLTLEPSRGTLRSLEASLSTLLSLQ